MKRGYPLYFLLPGLIVFTLFFGVPTISSLYYSLTDWNINASRLNFVGLSNFSDLFSDAKLVAALWHTIVYAVAVTLIRNLTGLLLALMLNAGARIQNVFRTVFFLPFVIAPIIIGYLFKAIYNPDHGVLNQVLHVIGLTGATVDWLNNPHIALFSTIMVDVWRTSGFAMVIYVAGLQVIPQELYEAADLDGANYPQKFFHVVFPLLAPALTINMVLSIIGTMKVFEMILVLTNGGPGYVTEVMNTYIMSDFSLGLYGAGTAANLVLSIIISLIGLPVLYWLRRREVEL